MQARELREKYLKFFEEKGHKIIPSASLIPENDPSVLFTTAGMHPLVPFLTGMSHPAGKRLADVQKCVRTGDIDEVGDATHHTFFEMLGNWSLGDYFKKEAIEMSWEFLTSKDYLNLDKNRIAVSVFAGDEDAPFDEEAFELWKNLGIPEKRIAKLPKENNWWGMEKGPCGPDTEIFYWVGNPNQVPESFNDDNEKWVEIWNNVFMQYDKKAEGVFEPLAQKNVDTGMGLERTLAALNGLDDNYKTELFWPIIEKIEAISGKKYEDNQKSFRIIADHVKAAVMIIADGVTPLNVGAGYVLRRLIRRAIRHGKILGVENNFTKEIAEVAIEIYQNVYLEVEKNKSKILEELEKEENKFRKTLENGLREFERAVDNFLSINDDGDLLLLTSGDKLVVNRELTGDVVFNLYATYGFPIELIREIAKEKGIKIDEKGFESEFKKHQDLSRTASAGKFKGGLADDSEETTKLHTVAHLMLAALRQVLGDHVTQRGANITAERLRFDFSHPEKMTDEQKKQVEDLVNEQIQKNIPVVCEEMTVDEAKAQGAMGVFDAKYGEKVKVYTIGDHSTHSTSSGHAFSMEICGGPHVANTGELGTFKIKKEESSSAGVRRIKAILA